MAVPTYISISSATGHAGGGQYVEITGTDFRTSDSSLVEIPDTQLLPTVQVIFFGTSAGHAWQSESPSVEAVSSTKLRVQVPQFRGDPNVPDLVDDALTHVSFPIASVTIKNLDADGAPIAGETVTETGVYTYTQALLRLPQAEPPIMSTLREFIKLLKRQVVSRVSADSHTDFAIDGASVTELSKRPSIDLLISTDRDPDYSQYDNEQILIDRTTHFDVHDYPMTVQIDVQIMMSSEFEHEVLRMVDGLFELMMRTPNLVTAVDLDQTDEGETDGYYPLDMVLYPQKIGRPSRVNVHAYQARIRIRGVPIIISDPTTKYFRRAAFRLTTDNLDAETPDPITISD